MLVGKLGLLGYCLHMGMAILWLLAATGNSTVASHVSSVAPSRGLLVVGRRAELVWDVPVLESLKSVGFFL